MKGDRGPDDREFYVAMAQAAFLVVLAVGLLLLAPWWG